MRAGIFRSTALLFILSLYGFCLTQKIDLTTADLGRHIKNGELVLAQNFSVLSKNTYSYTYPDSPVVNHHWGSGVLFFWIRNAFGFEGLSLFYLCLSLGAFFLMFRLAVKAGGFRSAVLLALFLLPLITARKEVRPEVFSAFFSASFFYLLWEHREGRISFKRLFWLPLGMILWVNTHIYFFLGIFLVGAFWLEKAFKDRQLGQLLILCVVASFVSPFGFKGALEPFQIFQNYGYRLVENQSVLFLEKINFIRPHFIYFKITLIVSALLFLYLFLKRREKFSIPAFLIGSAALAMASVAIRNFTLCGLLLLPILSHNFRWAAEGKISLPGIWRNLLAILAGVLFTGFLWGTHSSYFKVAALNLGTGLVPQNNASADFFRREKLTGPIFNNYDIGGFLIYHLFPGEKVFVDNRPEAYPSAFFKAVYVPAQADEATWREVDARYGFNTIYFGYHDYTPWAQTFLINRVNDPDWAPVFADAYAVIFLKKNERNESVIRRCELPKSAFRVISNK